jgi:putative ABC transport system permease protein
VSAAGLTRSRLLPIDVLRVGSIGLRARRLRAGLSALGIAIGIASMVGVLGLSDSSRADLLAQLDRLGTNLLTVTPGQSFLGANSTLPAASTVKAAALGSVQNASGVVSVDETVRRTRYIDPEETNGIALETAAPGLLRTLSASLSSGRFLSSATVHFPAVVLGATTAQRLGIASAGRGVEVYVGGEWFTVVGILRPVALAPEVDSAALIGYPIARRLFGTSYHPSTIYVRSNVDRVGYTRDLLPATANAEHPDEVTVSRPSDALAARVAAKGAFTSLLLGLGAVALLVGGVGIANVMVISVLERRSEIGLRRALGATRAHIAVQFLAESLLLAAVGGAVGVCLGAAVTAAFATARGWAAVVPAEALAGGIATALAIGAVAGLYPALRAARLSPTEALRSA